MSLFKGKKENNEPFTPKDLERLAKGSVDRKHRLMGLFSLRSASASVSVSHMVFKAAVLIAAGIVVFMGIAFVISSLIVNSGNLVIEVNKNLDSDKVISLSETANFEKPSSMLKAEPIKDMDNITYRWLPDDIDKKDGNHNGENYIAYSFYVKNAGKETLDYSGKIDIIGAAKSIDDAVRIMVCKNGEKTVYAKPRRKDGKTENDPDVTPVNFISSSVAMKTHTDALEVGKSDKYTIVIWLEGEDPECVNDVMGGILKMRMDFSVDEDKALEKTK